MSTLFFPREVPEVGQTIMAVPRTKDGQRRHHVIAKVVSRTPTDNKDDFWVQLSLPGAALEYNSLSDQWHFVLASSVYSGSDTSMQLCPEPRQALEIPNVLPLPGQTVHCEIPHRTTGKPLTFFQALILGVVFFQGDGWIDLELFHVVEDAELSYRGRSSDWQFTVRTGPGATKRPVGANVSILP